jgi:altronate dehydratase large subunit
MEFMGYRRTDGPGGTRNFVGVLSEVVCANEVVEAIVSSVAGTARFTHHQGCCQTPLDIGRVNHALVGLGRNPNLHSVLLVNLGCESTDLTGVLEGIRAAGKKAELLVIQETGGAARTTAAGILLAQEMVREASGQARETFPISKLMMGMKCGSSDTTSGLVPNPAIGVASDLLVAAGGTSILGEVTEFIGAEHLLARHAENETVAGRIFELVARTASGALTRAEISGYNNSMDIYMLGPVI